MDLSGILQVAVRTDVGRVRHRNEDYIGHAPENGVIVLADGMGGYKGGEVASAIAVNTVLDYLRERVPGIRAGEVDQETGYARASVLVRDAIIRANDTIYKTSCSQPQYQGMGTTIVVGMFYADRLTVAHVGDSRMYRYRKDQLDQITVDHTLLQELIDRGLCTSEDARVSPNRNLVTRALGVEPRIVVDLNEQEVRPQDIYLLCSDGLNDMIDDREIRTALRERRDDLARIAELLVGKANEQGGRDNISVLLARPTRVFPARSGWRDKLKDWFR